MKKLSRICAIILALSLVFALASCDALTPEPEPEKKAAGLEKIEKGSLKIGVLYSGAVETALGSMKSQRGGLKEAAGNLGLRFQDPKDALADNQFVEKENITPGDSAKLQKALDELIEAGCNVIISTDLAYADGVEAYAQKNVDTKHVFFYQYGSDKMNGKNLSSYDGRLYDAYYLAGIVAGAKLKELNETKIGFVTQTGKADTEATACVNAFALGAQSVVAGAQIQLKTAPQNPGETADALIANGCKVIAQYGDWQEPVRKAQEKKGFAIGFGEDISEEAPDAFLCAPVWNWTVCFELLMTNAMNATWKAENYYQGFNVGLSDICKLGKAASADAAALVTAAKGRLVSGENVIFTLPLKDTSDVDVTQEQIDAMNFYVKGIVEQ